MNLFTIKLFRKPFFAALLAVVVATAIALLAVSSTALLTTWEQLEQIENHYTITGIPLNVSSNGTSGERWDWGYDGTTRWLEGWSKVWEEISENFSGSITEDRRGFLAAHVAGCEPLTPYELSDFFNRHADYWGRALSVVAVRCTGVDYSEQDSSHYVNSKTGEIFLGNGAPDNYSPNDDLWRLETVTECDYLATFALEDVVCLFPPYQRVLKEALQQVWTFSVPFSKDGQIPFTEGNTYLLFGLCQGSNASLLSPPYEKEREWEVGDTIGLDFIPNYSARRISNIEGAPCYTNGVFSWKIFDDGVRRYKHLSDESLPFYAEYTSSWEDFINSEEGAVWREEIIPLCQLNYESAHVLLTENVDSTYIFNTGAASILEGRKFEAEEYERGDAVCLVSAAYAQKNNLTVGDAINLDFYRSGLYYSDANNMTSSEPNSADVIMTPEPSRTENRVDLQKDYSIIGVYTAPEFQGGIHSFTANTIIIPKRSIPNAENYEDLSKRALYSIVLEHDAKAEFEKYLASIGMRGMFEFFDQGHSELAAACEAANANALRLLGVSAAAFVLAGALFLLLSLRRLGPTARGMRLLGVKSRQVWREITEALGMLILISAAAGGVLGAALYGTVTERVIASSVALRPGVLVLCTLLLAVVLFLAAALCALPLARRSLMRTGGRRKK